MKERRLFLLVLVFLVLLGGAAGQRSGGPRQSVLFETGIMMP